MAKKDPINAEGTVYKTGGGRYWAVVTWRRTPRGHAEDHVDAALMEHRAESSTYRHYAQAKAWGQSLAARLGLAVTWIPARRRDADDG